ncbi:MAG TPA: hypothetical protein VG013_40560, partial [Gemmataceae bacterium]|nr:hypothetical protein [Gemmataceae bacterium]
MADLQSAGNAAEGPAAPGTSGAATAELSPQLAPVPKSRLQDDPVADPDLARVIAAWPDLPAPIKAAVL